MVAERAELRGERARLRRPVMAEGDGLRRQKTGREEFAPERNEFGAGSVGGREGDVLERGVVGVERDVERIHRFVEKRFEVFLPEGFVGDEKARHEDVFALVGDGFGRTRDHQAERKKHRDRAERQHRVDGRDEQPRLRRFASDGGEDGHRR